MDKYKITFETWNKIAALYQEKFMDLDLYNDSYDIFCTRLGKLNSSILEIGCGPGNITKYLLSKRPDFKIRAIDIAPNMIDLAKKNNPKADFQVMDCRAIDTLDHNFDAIICGFCMPYLSKTDCTKLIKDASTLLHEHGLFYFSIIEGEYHKSGFEAGSTGDKAYVYYHQSSFLENELSKNGFELKNLIQKNYPAKEESNQIHKIFIAQKHSSILSKSYYL